MHLSPSLAAASSQTQAAKTLVDFPKGSGSNAQQPDLSKAVSLSWTVHGRDRDKSDGNDLGFPAGPNQPFLWGNRLSRLLEESIATPVGQPVFQKSPQVPASAAVSAAPQRRSFQNSTLDVSSEQQNLKGQKAVTGHEVAYHRPKQFL